MIAIVVSRADRASEHIGEQLLTLDDWTEHVDARRPDADGGGTYYRTDGFELRTFEDLHIYLDDPARAFDDPDLLVFVSRHAGETGALLTTHFTGNFGPAEYGGEPQALARAAPNAQKRLVTAFENHAPDRYDVGIECTHHGPSEVSVPSLFAELGSGDEQWDDPEGARAVAGAVLELDGVDPDCNGGPGPNRQLVGFGGGHYAPRFTRIVDETEWGVGHVGSDWQLEAMGDPRKNREVIEVAFEQSAAEYAVVEGEKPELEAVIEDLGSRIVTETWVREVADRPLELVERVESRLAPVDAGVRFGESESGSDTPFEVAALPEELLSAAQGVDPDAARAAVEANAIAFETREGGTRATGDAAFPDLERRDVLVDALADVLREKYDEVERDDGRVVAREIGFDPEKAARFGVPEGPAFGRLAAGEPVEVDGRRIPPEQVRSEREDVFVVAPEQS